MSLLYLACLLCSIGCMLLIDRKYKLAWYYDARRTGLTVLCGMIMFIIWDMAGIVSGVFYSGESAYMSGFYIAPEFPIEELIFLAFLCYFTLIIYRIGEKRW